MFVHVIPEVFEQGNLLGHGLWEHFQSVIMFSPISFNVLHIPKKQYLQLICYSVIDLLIVKILETYCKNMWIYLDKYSCALHKNINFVFEFKNKDLNKNPRNC